VYTFTPSAYEIVHKKRAYKFKIVFDIVHNWWEMPWSNSTSRAAATSLFKEADAVICDSQPLANDLKSRYGRSISIVLPGVNESWINKLMIPSCDSTPLSNPSKIVFFGNLRENSDIQLISSLALSGAKIDAFGSATAEVRHSLNGLVEFKGSLNQDELFLAVKNYDFTLLPYSSDSFSKWISPAKYFEVLALGKPILSRSRLSHMPGWNRLCHNINIDVSNLEQSIDEQLKQIAERHLKDKNSEHGLMLARSHTWLNQLKKIEQVISSCQK
jgi:hypothetical protein